MTARPPATSGVVDAESVPSPRVRRDTWRQPGALRAMNMALRLGLLRRTRRTSPMRRSLAQRRPGGFVIASSFGRARVRDWFSAATLAFYGLVVPHGVLAPTPPTRHQTGERIAANDNRSPSGTLRDGVLTVRLEAREGDWYPAGNADPPITVRAFAEEGKPLQIPGPLLRVPRGTEVRAVIRNALRDSALYVHGFYTRGARA